MNPNVNAIFHHAVVDAMQSEVMTPEAQARSIISKLNMAVNPEHTMPAMVDILCGPATGFETVDQIAQRIVLRFVQGMNRVRAWEALGYETRYAGKGNNLLMSGQSALETVHVG